MWAPRTFQQEELMETYDELAAKSEDFNKIYASWQKFLAESNLWFRLAENNLDNYRYIVAAQQR
jgi:TRAP-type mannitol/chloroaromatic compound transport system substrate-binding protein